MKYIFKVPPSKTEQTIEIPIPDLPATITPVITGTTPLDPVVTPPPTDKPPIEGYQQTFRLDFSNSNDLDPDDHGQKGNGYIANGAFVSRPADVSSGIRSEIQFDDDRTTNEGAIEYDVAYNYFVKNQCHSFQFHPNRSGSSACLALWHINGQLSVTHNEGGSNFHQNTGKITPVIGQKYHMRVEYRFGTDGYFNWYIDGKLYHSYKGKLGDGTGQYLKIGFNGGFDGNKTEAMRSNITYDNIVIYDKV